MDTDMVLTIGAPEAPSACPFHKAAATATATPISTPTTSAPPATPEVADTLLARLGGDAVLSIAVDEFYARLVVEPSLARFFEGVDMQRLKRHQVTFMKVAFTGIPEGMDVEGAMRKGHARLFDMGLNETHFDTVAGVLVGTLQSLGVQQQEVDDVVSTVGPLRSMFRNEKVEC